MRERYIYTTEANRVPGHWRVFLQVHDASSTDDGQPKLELVDKIAKDYPAEEYSAAEASADLLTFYAISKPATLDPFRV